jgi:poly(A) polymerase
MEILSRRKITVIPTGLKHGTVTVIFKNEKFEITTLRRDISTNGRHAKVQFTDSFEEDAARRDFTINALSYCPFKEELYDYHNGIEDLQNQRVVFIGDPYKRIKEDFLRILRFFRFSCYYAKDLDKASLEACSELKESLKLISRERIKSEFDKIILHPNSLPTLQAMDEIGLLKSIMPIENYDPSRLQSLWDFLSKHQLMHIKSIEILYALLLSNLDKKRLLALKFSKSESAQILSLQETMNDWSLHSTEFNLLKLWLNRLNYVTYIAVVVASGKISEKIASRFISEHQQLTRPKFPVTGVDLKNSLQPKEIGLKLKELKDLWIESGFKLTKSELLGSGSKIDL